MNDKMIPYNAAFTMSWNDHNNSDTANHNELVFKVIPASDNAEIFAGSLMF